MDQIIAKIEQTPDITLNELIVEFNLHIYTAVKRQSYLFIAFSVGKCTQQTCLCMVRKLAKTLKVSSLQCPLEVFTDGNDDYTYVLPQCFALGLIDYGQLIKIREHGRVVRKEKLVVYGNPSFSVVETPDVENFNGILRERLGRLVRKSKCFSKVKRRLVCAVELFRFYWNFINEFKRGVSPAKLEGLMDRLWTWHEFFHYNPHIR
jgi:IS1 family transposase